MKRLKVALERLQGKSSLVCLKALTAMYADDTEEKMAYQTPDGQRGWGYQVYGGIALIPVLGLLGNDWYADTNYMDIQSGIAKAIADPAVSGILLLVNSPGGYTDNAFETAAAIGAVEKPCIAMVDTMAYSGAYLLASQADRIIVAPVTGGVGSIGVYAAHFDYSEYLKQVGIAVTLISEGEGKTDGNPYEPLSEAALAKWKAEIARLYGEFVGAVSSGRDMAAKDVIALGANLFEGSKAAIASGLADEAGDIVAAVKAVSSSAASAAKARGKAMEGTGTTPAAEGKQLTAAETEVLLTQARAEGYGEAADVLGVCTGFGMAAKAGDFIRAKKPLAEVCRELMVARAAAAGPEMQTQVLPGADTEGKPAGKESPLVKAAKKAAEVFKGGRR